MVSLKEEIEKAVGSGKLDVTEARRLLRIPWKEASAVYPTRTRADIQVFFLLVEGLVHEVEEGYVAGEENDAQLLERATALLLEL